MSGEITHWEHRDGESAWCTVEEDGKSALLCKVCGLRMEYRLPMPVTAFVKLTKSFAAQHKACAPRPSPRRGGAK